MFSLINKPKKGKKPLKKPSKRSILTLKKVLIGTFLFTLTFKASHNEAPKNPSQLYLRDFWGKGQHPKT
jgi:hypothetical protein